MLFDQHEDEVTPDVVALADMVTSSYQPFLFQSTMIITIIIIIIIIMIIIMISFES